MRRGWLAIVLVAGCAAIGAGVTGSAHGAADPVVAAAGDIACDPGASNFTGTATSCHMAATAALVQSLAPAAVLPLGDNQYFCGSAAAYRASYDQTWGSFKSITRPTSGNHEYIDSLSATQSGTGCDGSNTGAQGYFGYFGAAAGASGQGWYSYDVGAWHLISLNSQCSRVKCTVGSPQESWLRNDLAQNAGKCLLAYMHVPYWSSGPQAATYTQPLMQDLYNAGTDVLLTGHDHDYERFAPQDLQGAPDAAHGIREFVVGTGGANHTAFKTIAPNSEARDAATFGVLALTLHATSYDWRFVPEPGKAFTDSGSSACHLAGPPPPPAPTGVQAVGSSSSQVDVSWSAPTGGADHYLVLRNAAQVASTTATSFGDTGLAPSTTYSYTVESCNAANACSAPSTPAAQGTTEAAPPPPPAPPTGVQAVGSSSSQVDVSWSAPTGGADHYLVLRNAAQVASTTATSFGDTGLAPSTTYSYTVESCNAANACSAPSTPAAQGTTQAVAGTVTTTLHPVADTRTDSTTATTSTTNYGTQTTLKVDSSLPVWSFLRFDLSGLSGTVTGATLRVFANSAQSTGYDVYGLFDNSWSETGLTWANQPTAAIAATKTGSSGKVTAGTWTSVDVSSLVSAGTLRSFVLETTNSTALSLASREDATHPPELVVTTVP